MDLAADSDLPAYFGAVGASQGTAGPIGELIAQIAAGRLDPIGYREVCARHGVGAEPWFRVQRLDLVLAYARHCLESRGRLSAPQIADLRTLRTFLHVRDGEFLGSRPAEVAHLVRAQLDDILADAVIDDAEDCYQVELQAIFGLGYDDYLAMTRVVFERVWADLSAEVRLEAGLSTRPASRKLAALEPIVRMATARPRTLGALYGWCSAPLPNEALQLSGTRGRPAAALGPVPPRLYRAPKARS